MSKNLYIMGTEAKSGKSLITLGIMELLFRNTGNVAFFRPFVAKGKEADKKDNDIRLISSCYDIYLSYEDMYGYTGKEASKLVADDKYDTLIEGILTKFSKLNETHDFVVCEGTDFISSYASFELDINAIVANQLGCSVLLVANAHKRPIPHVVHSIEISLESLRLKGNKVIAIFVNRVHPDNKEEIINILAKKYKNEGLLIYAIENVEDLGNPTMREIADTLGAEVLFGDYRLNQHVHNYAVAAMHLGEFLERLPYGSLVITPGDRADIIVGCLSALGSSKMPYIAGLLLTGGIKPDSSVMKLISGFKRVIPILSVETDTFPSTRIVDRLHTVISPEDHQKTNLALSVFEKQVDMDTLGKKVITTFSSIVTPKMFEHHLIREAMSDKKHIVLPEGEENRILRSAEILLQREVVDITLLGNTATIKGKIDELGLKFKNVRIVDPVKSEHYEEYAFQYYEMRKHKGMTLDRARDILSDVNFFGTMMVLNDHADGLVSGSVHTTAATIRPAFEIIKTKPSVNIVSSVMFMCLKDRVLVYGDCAINPNPSPEELSDIAISSAETAKRFGVEPRIAMLSYSTGASGKGDDVDLVREATRIAKEKAADMCPSVKIEGPIQYDAAIDPDVAKTKMPESEVAGKATVFIFPDLNTGNNTYKAVQRSAQAIAIGPVLQGLNKPVNDLSRGCLIPDIINTVAITAIQAQKK